MKLFGLIVSVVVMFFTLAPVLALFGGIVSAILFVIGYVFVSMFSM